MLQQPDVSLAPGATVSDQDIAEHFCLNVATSPLPSTWQVCRSAGQICLRAPAEQGGYELVLSCTQGPMARRLQTAKRTDPLPRALGMHRRRVERVVDATAGLGRDAMVLSRLGCSVTAIERVPALCFLMEVCAREADAELQVIRADAAAWLREHARDEEPPDAVYLDPMFAEAGKAQVKKEMQACRALAGPPTDTLELLRVAREAARDRVVVKRHPHHAPLTDDVSFEVKSGRVRFDVYLCP